MLAVELGLKVQKEVSGPTVDWRKLQHESLQGVYCYVSKLSRRQNSIKRFRMENI